MQEFELFTNTEAMRDRFQRELPGFSQGELAITACRVLRTRYKSLLEDGSRHRSFLYVHYELDVAGRGGKRLGAQQLYAKAYLNGRSRRKYHQTRTIGLARPQFGEALVHLPNLDLIVWAFPNDPELPQLPAVLDGAQVKRHLPYDQLPACFNTPEAIEAVGVEVVRYKPEVRCTVRYRLRRDGLSGRQTYTLYGKTYASKRGAEIHRHIEALWRRSQAEAGHFIVARPLGYDAALHVVWQEAVPGVPLNEVLSAATFEHYLPLAANGLANLHHSDLTPPRRVSPVDLAAGLGESAAELSAALPEVRARVQHLWARVEQGAPKAASAPLRVIHRDFHVKQLVVHPDDAGQNPALAIFDFDDLVLGDPLQDIAFFLVDLHFREFETTLVARMAASFCRAYEAQVGAPLDGQRLHWQFRLQLLAKAHWYYKKKQLSPRLATHVQRILSLAEQETLFDLE